MPQIISGYEIYKGKTLKQNNYSTGWFQPLQFLPMEEKGDLWVSQMISYVDWQSMTQLKANANWMMKNYKLAIGEIEKSDYIRQDNEFADMVDALEQHSGKVLESMEFKDFPFASTVVNILCDEFAKRVSHMSFDDKSDLGVNEMLDQKKEDIAQYLELQAAIKQQDAMLKMGISPDSEQGQQMMDPQAIKNLPQIQKFYNKSYRNIYQEWAEHQMEVDNERFSMPELEKMNFRNMLITDREYWHFRMMDSDYQIETWNPPQVGYRKSPSTRYISDAAWVCYVDYLTVPDVVDREGWKMSEEQLLSLNTLNGARAAMYALDGKEPDQYWDGSRSYEWNRTGPGLGMRQAMSVLDGVGGGQGGDITRAILNESEDIVNVSGEYMVRVSTIYWKTMRKFYHLTKVDDQGNQVQDVVGEDYKVTTKPMYNTVLFKEKTKENLIYGEHLDPLWVPETWGGMRLGTNAPSIGWQGTSTSFAPIYLGIKGSTPGRLPFQFKGDDNLYGCKLPVEGRVFNDHNTKSRSMLDNLKMWQVLVNMTGNLIQDTMINDFGVVAQIDPNALPKHSMGEDYGPNTWAAAATIMKTGGVIPMISNNRNADGQVIGNEPLRAVDLSQTNRLLGLMKIFDWAKMNGLDSVGMNPRRTGTPIGQEATATEVKQDVASSYSHTEYLFSQHSDELMPRVHQMRTDLAQYYNSTNPSLRLQYMTSDDIKGLFMIDGTKLLGRDFNVKSKTSVNSRAIMAKIEQMLIQDNTSDTDFYDKIKAVQTPTLSSLNTLMAEFQQKKQQQIQQQQQIEQDQQKAEQDHQAQMLQETQAFEAEQNQLDRDEKFREVQLMAASKAASLGDSPEAGEGTYQEATKLVQNQQQHNDKIDLERQKLATSVDLEKQKIDVQKQKVAAEGQRTRIMAHQATIANKQKAKEKKSK